MKLSPWFLWAKVDWPVLLTGVQLLTGAGLPVHIAKLRIAQGIYKVKDYRDKKKAPAITGAF